MSDKLIEAIEHYQRNLNRGLKDDNTTKLLHCIFKLSNLPITVGHLEETGVGRTVNAMRKMEGKVGDASRELVNKWKLMVSQNQDCDDTNKNEPNGKSDSSHRQSDKSKNRSDNSDSESENSSSEEKSSESENDEEDENDSDGYEDVKRHKSESPPREKHKSHHHHHKKSSKDSKNKSRSHPNKDYERKEKEYKYKRDKSPSRSPEKIKSSKEKDRSKSNSSSSSNKRKNDEENERSHSKKHKSHHNKEDEIVNETKRIKDKSRIESKHKDSNQSYSQSSNQSSHSSNQLSHSSNQSSHSMLKEVKKDSKRDSYDKKSKSKEKDEKIDERKEGKKDEKKDERKDEKKYSDKIKKEPKSNRNENGICSESGTSFADALGMLEPSTSRTTVVTNSNKKSKPERSIREKTPEKSYRKESFDKEDKKEKKKERDRDRDKESSKHEKSKERDKKVSTSSSKIDLVVPPPPPKNDLDINISSLLPMITPNYRPLANPLHDNMQNLGRGKALNDDEALSLVMSQKNQRTKVYSGNKMFFNSIPSLFELCIRVLQDNIDALEYTGGVPYVILKPVLDKASPQQLYTMEHYNPYLIEDTDELWQFHCSKDFKNKRREELESWREMYMRCLDEREAKLKALTENIKVAQEKSTPVRQTKLAYIDSFVKPPRDVIRKQAKNGIDKKPLITPQSRLNAIAAGNSSAQVSVPNPVRASSNNSSGAVKPKKAPLMQKTLAFLKGGRFRR